MMLLSTAPLRGEHGPQHAGSFYKLLRGSPEHLAASISFPIWAEEVELAYHEVNGLIGAPAQGPPEQLGQSLAQALDRAVGTVSRGAFFKDTDEPAKHVLRHRGLHGLRGLLCAPPCRSAEVRQHADQLWDTLDLLAVRLRRLQWLDKESCSLIQDHDNAAQGDVPSSSPDVHIEPIGNPAPPLLPPASIFIAAALALGDLRRP